MSNIEVILTRLENDDSLMKIGTETSEQELFVELKKGLTTVIPRRPVLVLFSIFVPEHLRNQGVTSRIVSAMERRAEKNGYCAVMVGPLIGDDILPGMLDRRGYVPIMGYFAIKYIGV